MFFGDAVTTQPLTCWQFNFSHAGLFEDHGYLGYLGYLLSKLLKDKDKTAGATIQFIQIAAARSRKPFGINALRLDSDF